YAQPQARPLPRFAEDLRLYLSAPTAQVSLAQACAARSAQTSAQSLSSHHSQRAKDTSARACCSKEPEPGCLAHEHLISSAQELSRQPLRPGSNPQPCGAALPAQELQLT